MDEKVIFVILMTKKNFVIIAILLEILTLRFMFLFFLLINYTSLNTRCQIIRGVKGPNTNI